MTKIEKLAKCLLLALASSLLPQEEAGLRNAISDLQMAIWESRDV